LEKVETGPLGFEAFFLCILFGYVSEALLEVPGDFDFSKAFREVLVFDFVGVSNYPSALVCSSGLSLLSG